MQLDFPSNVDTAAMGRLLLRLRDQIDQINASLDQPDPEAQRRAVEAARAMLSQESANVMSMQDSVLSSSSSYQQLPPIRIVEPSEGDITQRINRIIDRASVATGLEWSQKPKEIKYETDNNPPNTDYTKSALSYELPSVAENQSSNQKNKPKQAGGDNFTGDRRGHEALAWGKIARGTNTSNLPVRPKCQAQTEPFKEIKQDDIERGILNLIDRGLVPPAAEIQLKPSPIVYDKAKLNASRQHIEALKDRTKTSIEESNVKLQAQVKLDHSNGLVDGGAAAVVANPMTNTPLPPPVTPANQVAGNSMYFMGSMVRYNESKNSGLIDIYSAVIKQGVTRCNELACIEHLGEELWRTAIDDIIPMLEQISADYAIPLMIINKSHLKKTAEWAQLAWPRRITKREVIQAVENKDEVVALMEEPGRVYSGARREHLAACKITALFKGKLQRAKFLTHRKQQQAAGIIAVSWIMTVRMRRRKQVLIEQRQKRLEGYYARLSRLRANWPLRTDRKKVLIHLPSLGYPKKIRFTATDLERRQMSQITRLVDSVDENTHVIFVSPMPFTDDLRRYYTRLLGMGPAVKTRLPQNLDDEEEVQSRFTIIVPEAASKFPTHCMNLAQHLNYSCEAMTRLKLLTTGTQALIIPGVVCHDTLAIGDFLDIPIYGADPEVAHLYSTKSGSRRIFQAAKVDMPPGECDVYTIQQLIECLAELVTTYPHINTWVIKLDCQFDNRGAYVLDVERNLPTLPFVRRERAKAGAEWKHKSFQQTSYLYVLNQLPKALSTCKPANPAAAAAYPSWDAFQAEYCRQGGIVEAVPASDDVTNISVDVEIEPNGHVRMLTCGDQIHSKPFYCWGWSCPQASVDAELLHQLTMRIAHQAKARKILGYVKITFLTFLDEQNCQHVWATGMKVAPSDLLYMSKLLEFSTGTTLDAKRAKLEVEVESLEKQTKEVQIVPSRATGASTTQMTRKNTTLNKVIRKQSRFAVISTQLLHTNLAILHYTVFFQMCRAHAIGWDVRSKIGTLFTLLDTVKRENIGMIYCGNSLKDAIYNFARGLHVIHQEISAPNMQGTTNFHAALKNIEAILQMIEANVATDFGRDVIKLTSSLDKISSTRFEALLEGPTTSDEPETASS